MVSPADNGNVHTPSLFVDYRHFDAANIKPRFEFGFGLSYTNFCYSGLSITVVDGGQDHDTQLEANWLAGKPDPHGVGASSALWLHRPAYDISFTVQNMGNVAGTVLRKLSPVHLSVLTHADKTNTDIPAVPALPIAGGRASSVLRGFADVDIHPGESKTVCVTLSRYDLSIWDVTSQSWMRAEGTEHIPSIGRCERSGSQVEKKISPLNQRTVILWDDFSEPTSSSMNVILFVCLSPLFPLVNVNDDILGCLM